jgi:hypothetical protein
MALELCERLRVARGLSPRSRYGADLFQAASRSSLGAPVLDGTVRLTFSQPTPLGAIVRRLQEATGTKILIDWQALATAHWALRAEATLSADGIPLRDALDALLTPMDLNYRVIDATTLQITTPLILYTRAELELYPVKELLSEGGTGEELIHRIQNAMGGELFRGARPLGSIYLDKPSGHLVARMPQPYQHQLETLLQSWREDE